MIPYRRSGHPHGSGAVPAVNGRWLMAAGWVLAVLAVLAACQPTSDNLLGPAEEDEAPAEDTPPEDVAKPVFSPSPGYYQQDQEVVLSTATDKAQIRYTIDGSDPTAAGEPYQSPISVSGDGTSVEIRAYATAPDMNPSGVTSGTYTIDRTVPAAPTILGVAAGTYDAAQSFTLGELESGAAAEYSLDNGDTWEDYGAAVSLPGDASYSITARQRDLAGNTSPTTETVQVIVDTTSSADGGPLLITEVGSNSFINTSAWFEVYNPASYAVDLSSFQLRSPARLRTEPYTEAFEVVFALPSVEIPPGGYAVVRGRTSDDYTTGARTAYVVNASDQVPNWSYIPGYLELLHAGHTVDFLRFGNSTAEPTSPAQWGSGSAPDLPSGDGSYGRSLARSATNADTDAAADWSLRDFTTPGGPNDVTTTTDTDGDGIPDANEQAGATYAGLPLHAWGARPDTPDIFIHIDYMDSADPGVIPRERAMDAVADAFAAEGFAVHIDVGDLFHNASGVDPSRYDLSDRNHVVPYAQSISFENQSGYAAFYDYKYQHMPIARKQIFHYVLFAYSQQPDGSSGSGGIAELFGNDVIISLGNWGLSTDTVKDRNLLDNYQAATLMHELGHNLGLRHGGDEDQNFKPNYFSIMNYLYAFALLPDIGTADDEGDRYYLEYSAELGLSDYQFINDIHLNPYDYPPDQVNMDFSHGIGGQLDEGGLDESVGLGQPDGSGVDYNGDGDAVDSLGSFNVNPRWDGGTSVLHDFDDWSNLELFFGRYISGATDTAEQPPGPGAGSLKRDPVWNDRQEIYPEETPHAVIEWIRSLP